MLWVYHRNVRIQRRVGILAFEDVATALADPRVHDGDAFVNGVSASVILGGADKPQARRPLRLNLAQHALLQALPSPPVREQEV